MVPIERVVSGVSKYIDSEILPQLPPAKAVLAGTVAVLYLNQASSFIDKIPESLKIKKGSNIDIDAIKAALKSQMKDEIQIDIPFIGKLTVDSAEIDKICKYIASEN